MTAAASSKQPALRLLAAAALALAACNPDAAGQIPCVEDVSCPNDFPVCGPAGKCIAGTSTAGASVAILGADGHAASDFLSGSVRVLVSARAASGVKSVSLTSGSTTFPASATAAAPPIFAFDVNTTSLADGDASLTAALTAGDGTTGTATGTLHVDNAKPVITTFTVGGATAATITPGKTVAISASFSGGSATIAASTGGSLGLTSGASVLVSPDVTTSYKLTVTSRSGVTVRSGDAGQPPDVSVSVVPAAVPVITSFTFQSNGLTSATFDPGQDVVLAHVYDAKGGTATINALPAGPTGGTTTFANVQARTVYRLTVTSADGISAFSDATASVNAKVNAFSVGATQGASSGTATITSGGTTTLFASFAGSGASGNANATVSCAPSCGGTLLAGTSIANNGALTVTGNQNGALTYALTVAAGTGGAQAQATVLVNVVPQANATSLSPSSTIHLGASATITPTFNFGASPVLQGTATITGSDGSVYAGLTSGTGVGVSPTTTTTYTLHVSNAAGAPAATTPTAVVTVAPGTWSSFNTTSEVRKGATVTALDTGKILIAGGADLSNAPLDTARLCDATGACVSKTMGSKRAFHTATKITSGTNAGKVLLTGGFTAAGLTSPTDSAEFFDPATETFSNTVNITPAAPPKPRARHVAVLLSGGSVVLLAGGTNGTTDLNTAIKYDSATPTATASGNMAQPRANFTGTALGTGKVLIVGGKSADVSAELFDPAANGNVGAFAATGQSLPTNEDKRNHTAVLIDNLANLTGQVLISGGTTTLAAGPSATQFLYNPTNDTFTAAGSLATARTRHAATTFNSLSSSKVLICGGMDGGSNPLQSCERFDPEQGALGTVFPTGPMIDPRADFGLAKITISSLEEILAAGSPSSPLSFAETYDPL